MTAPARVGPGRFQVGVAHFARLREAGIAVVVGSLVALFGLLQPRFLTVDNLTSIGKQSSIFAILAAGSALVIITRNIDLSVGSTTGLTAVATGIVVRDHPAIPTAALVAIGILVGLGCGLLNGALVVWGNVPSIVATLGTLALFRGAAFVLGGNKEINGQDVPRRIGQLSVTSPLGLSWLVIFALLTLTVGWVYLSQTRSGRYFYATGCNPEAAAARGVPVRRTVFAAFAVSGALAGLAGVLYLSKFGAVDPQTAGLGYELFAISAVVVGGTNIFGGTGGMIHTFFGVLLIGVVSNGLTITGLSNAWQTVAQGAIILLAVTLDSAIRASYARNRSIARRRFT